MSSNIDQDFVEYIVKSLVGNPDKVTIDRRIDEKGVLLELTVDPEDLGRIIGKRGATAQSLRTLLRALGTKNDARYNLKIIDNGPEDYERPARKPEPVQSSASDDGATSDDTTSDDTSNAQVEDEVIEPSEPEELDGSENSTEEDVDLDVTDEPSDMAKKTRRELEDLDDLDI